MNLKKNIATIRFLSDEDVKKIHESTLIALESIGVEILQDDGLAMLSEAGAKINWKTKQAKLPSYLVEQCLETLPKIIVLGGRNDNYDLVLKPGGKVYSRNGGGPSLIEDIASGEMRYATETDVRNYARLVDAMEHVDIVAPIYTKDFPINTMDIRVLRVLFESTSKHINMRLLNLHSLPYVIRMAEVVAGSKEDLRQRPVITMLESPIAPLKIPDVLVEVLKTSGEYGIPLEICSMPICGATGPYTLAGSVLTANIEIVASIVISQIAHPGAPLIYAPRIMMMDMHSGYAMTGSIENALMTAAGVQIANEVYQIPVNMHGPYTDSHLCDMQAGIENTYFTFLSAFAGVNILTGAGHLEGGLMISYSQLLIDNELLGMIERAIDGFVVNDNTLGLDAIARSVTSNNFLLDKHTLNNLRTSKFYKPLLFNREPRDKWIDSGSKKMEERAREVALDLLKNYSPKPLPPEISRSLAEIVDEATAKYDQT